MPNDNVILPWPVKPRLPQPQSIWWRLLKTGLIITTTAVFTFWGSTKVLDSILDDWREAHKAITGNLKQQIDTQQKIIDIQDKQIAKYQTAYEILGDQINNLGSQIDELQSIQSLYDNLRNEITRYTLETRGAVKCKDNNDQIFTIAAEDVNNNDFLNDFVFDGVDSGRCDPMLLLPAYKVMEFYNLDFEPDLSEPAFPKIVVPTPSLGD